MCGDTASEVDTNWPKKYSISCDVMLNNKTSGRSSWRTQIQEWALSKTQFLKNIQTKINLITVKLGKYMNTFEDSCWSHIFVSKVKKYFFCPRFISVINTQTYTQIHKNKHLRSFKYRLHFCIVPGILILQNYRSGSHEVNSDDFLWILSFKQP